MAASFASVAQAMRERGHDPSAVAHFVNRLVFCMFADDRGWHRIADHDRPARTPPKTLALLAAAKRAGSAISTIAEQETPS